MVKNGHIVKVGKGRCPQPVKMLALMEILMGWGLQTPRYGKSGWYFSKKNGHCDRFLRCQKVLLKLQRVAVY